MTKIIFSILFLLTVVLPASADSQHASAQKYIETIINGIVVEVQSNKDIYANNQGRLFELIDSRIMPSVNVELFSRLSLGKHWNIANTSQRQLFTQYLSLIHI